jgi:hypothetical protein
MTFPAVLCKALIQKAGVQKATIQKASRAFLCFGVLMVSLTLPACETTQRGNLRTGSPATPSDFNALAAYPRPTVTHLYTTPFDINPQASASQRRLYVDLINVSTGKDGYAPRYYVITAGQDDVTLVAVAAQKKYLENIYQARAGLNRFGAGARLLPLLQGHKEAGDYNTLDLLYHLGFQRLVLTNGDDFTYRIDLQKKTPSPAQSWGHDSEGSLKG